MPEFVLEGRDEPQYKEQDAFTQGYIEAMFFSSTSSADDGELKDSSVVDLSPDAWEDIIKDCADFKKAAKGLLAKAYKTPLRDRGTPKVYDEAAAGRDFWFTRNGHGVGFWDRGLGDVGAELTELCGWRTQWSERDLYKGDDGKIYLQG